MSKFQRHIICYLYVCVASLDSLLFQNWEVLIYIGDFYLVTLKI